MPALVQDCQNNQCGPTPSPLTPAHTHLSKSSEAIADEVDAPTGSDSGSLAKDTNDPGPKATVKNVDLSEEVVDVAYAALEKYNIEDIAAQVRTE